ncbi:hypothetical protein Pcinc_024694 [Petrolisthes cinctipes]|uniref:Uncharacterized protein n=1 Tax=Petrolisthes cinctipes TaxID=88211 RepID=A0AAE1FA27_PETCI|nr:hypothetical protein Pcinc_024694 [Petrolisthes cinctipes]
MEQEHLTTSLPSMNLPTSHGVTPYTTTYSSPDVFWGGAMPDSEHTLGPKFPATTTQSNPSVSSTSGCEALGLSGTSTVSDRKKKSGCKVKMYELPKQDDAKLEKRRKLAVKEFKKRQRVKKEEEDLRQVLATTTQETNTIKEKIIQSKENINWYSQQLSLIEPSVQFSQTDGATQDICYYTAAP